MSLDGDDLSISARRPFADTWARVLVRRRAARELDRLLGCYPCPSPHELYGMTPALARMLESEAYGLREAS